MITVIGKLEDCAKFAGIAGYNVYAKSADWTPRKNFIWLCEAVERGDSFLIVSTDMTGYFKRELQDLLEILEFNTSRLKGVD